jgi:phosphotransacetylase
MNTAIAATNFADQVLRELVVAMGAALFIGNLLALVRRSRPAQDSDGELETDAAADDAIAPRPAPVARTLVYLVIGLVVMVWGIASIAVS